MVPLSHFRALGTCASSGPAAVHLSIRRLGCPGTSQGPRHLCPLVPGALASDRGENISGPLAPASPLSKPLRGCVSGPSAPALPAGRGAGLWGVLGRAYQGPRHLRPLALRHGGKRVRALGTCAIHPSLNFREDDRLRLSVHALVGVRGEGDGGLGVLCCVGLHGHPRAQEGEMPETSGASQVHLRLSMEVLLRQLRNLERSRPPAAPHCDSICVQ